MRIAVFLPNLIGDTVMATPTLRALRAGFPEATLIGVMRASVAPTLAGSPWLDELFLYHPRSADHNRRFMGVVRGLRSRRIDAAVLLPNSFRSAWMARLGGARRVVGYARGGRSWLLSDRLAPPRDERGRYLPTPIVGYYLELARRLGCPIDSPRLELHTTPGEEADADAAWKNLGLAGRGPVVCLNTGGAFGPAKNWPEPHFARLARRLVAEAGARVLVLCGPAERQTARRIVALAESEAVVSLADEPVSIGLTKASIRRADLLVTTDSGPRHFATAFGVPVISLFGPTHIAWTRTYHPLALHLRVPVPCGPCQRPTCGEGHHRCMTDLDPDSVALAALRLLESGSVSRLDGKPSRPVDRARWATNPGHGLAGPAGLPDHARRSS